MAIQRKTSTPTTDRPAADLTAGFGDGAPKLPGGAYTRKTQVMLTHEQYEQLEQTPAERGYPRHGGPSRVIREALAKDIDGFQP